MDAKETLEKFKSLREKEWQKEARPNHIAFLNADDVEKFVELYEKPLADNMPE